MKLQVGKTYLNGTGHKVKIVSDTKNDVYKFVGSDGICYSEDGKRYAFTRCKSDLIEEFVEINTNPAEDLLKAIAEGQQLQMKSLVDSRWIPCTHKTALLRIAAGFHSDVRVKQQTDWSKVLSGTPIKDVVSNKACMTGYFLSYLDGDVFYTRNRITKYDQEYCLRRAVAPEIIDRDSE